MLTPPSPFPREATSFPNPEAAPFCYSPSYPPPPAASPLSSPSPFSSSSGPLLCASSSSYTAAFPTPVEAYQKTSQSSCPPSPPPVLPWQQRRSPAPSYPFGRISSRGVSGFSHAFKHQQSRTSVSSHGPQGRHHGTPTLTNSKFAKGGNGSSGGTSSPPLQQPHQKKPTPIAPSALVIHSKPYGLFGPIPKHVLKEGYKQRIAGVDVLRLPDGTILPRIDGSSLQQLLHTNPGEFPKLEKILTECVTFLYNEGIKPFAGEIAHQMRKRTEGGSWLPSEVVALAVAASDVIPQVERRVKGEDGWVVLLREGLAPESFDGFVDTRARDDCYSAEQWLEFNRYFIEKMRNSSNAEDGGSLKAPVFTEGRYALAERLRQEIPMFKDMKLAHLIRMVQLASWKKLLTYRDKALVPVAACPVAAKEFVQRNSLTTPGSPESMNTLATVDHLLCALGRIVDPEPTGIFLAQVKDLVRWTTYERLDCMVLGHTKLQDLLLSEPFNRYYRLYTPEGNEHCTYVQSTRYPLPWGAVLHTRSSTLWDRETCPMEPPSSQYLTNPFLASWEQCPSVPSVVSLSTQWQDTLFTVHSNEEELLAMENSRNGQKVDDAKSVDKNKESEQPSLCELEKINRATEYNFGSSLFSLTAEEKAAGDKDPILPSPVQAAVFPTCGYRQRLVPHISTREDESDIHIATPPETSPQKTFASPAKAEEESDVTFKWVEDDITRLIEGDCSRLSVVCGKRKKADMSPSNADDDDGNSELVETTHTDPEEHAGRLTDLSSLFAEPLLLLVPSSIEPLASSSLLQYTCAATHEEMSLFGRSSENYKVGCHESLDVWCPDVSLSCVPTEGDASFSMRGVCASDMDGSLLFSSAGNAPKIPQKDRSLEKMPPEKSETAMGRHLATVSPITSGGDDLCCAHSNWERKRDENTGITKTGDSGVTGTCASERISQKKSENAWGSITSGTAEAIMTLSCLVPSFLFGAASTTFYSEDEDSAAKTPSTSCDGQYSLPSPPNLHEVIGEELGTGRKTTPQKTRKAETSFSSDHIGLDFSKAG
ncbi:hypothetical protein BESB_056590 [Besnoitia besnoiti]|uniref:HTH OST-type domain-containing protein n=1 Tax=Besnoitia besnoiti TaxID=94643 RepID=A0A2A9MC00_BESBE|nr:hypothetical protein BESB_056590 [Besnoitia besnoiti]PFH36008.1 hypothetical protein BESB_056590 [Besnoitia besnoiti]